MVVTCTCPPNPRKSRRAHPNLRKKKPSAKKIKKIANQKPAAPKKNPQSLLACCSAAHPKFARPRRLGLEVHVSPRYRLAPQSSPGLVCPSRPQLPSPQSSTIKLYLGAMQLLEDILNYLALDFLWPQPRCLLVSLTFLLTIDLVKCIRCETSPVTNRKRFIQIDCDDITEEDIKYFNKIKSRGGILPTLDNDSTRASYIIDQILRNMHKVIKQPQLLQRYLYGMKWEVIVDAKLKLRACSIRSMRKIIIQQDFLQRPQVDGKIAFVIGRMVADNFGRYNSEVHANFILCGYIMWMVVACIVIKPPHLLLLLAFLLGSFCYLAKLLQMTNHRTQMEVDYIGMLLSASAGYDPREAPQALMDKDIEYLNWRKSFRSRFIFPTSSERSRSLLESRAIEEALALYDDIKEKH